MENKVALVVGASSGIGRAVATALAASGARVVVGARREKSLEQLVSEIESTGAQAVALAGDIGEEGYAEALVGLAIDRFGRLDLAFDNAGTLGALGPLTEVTAEGWAKTLQTNLTGMFYALKHQMPALAATGGGSIVVTSSFVGHTAALAGMGPYAASKAGLLGLVRTAAVEGAEAGTRVNALLPGGTDTAMGREAADTPEARDYVAGLHALKRMAAPEEAAEAALFLLSEAASFVTGSLLFVDGGISIHRA